MRCWEVGGEKKERDRQRGIQGEVRDGERERGRERDRRTEKEKGGKKRMYGILHNLISLFLPSLCHPFLLQSSWKQKREKEGGIKETEEEKR